MHPTTIALLKTLAPQIKNSPVDECLHCTIAGNGSLAAASAITTTTFPRTDHEDVLEDLKNIATSRPSEVSARFGFHLFWMFNDVYLLSPTAEPDFPHALRRMACRVEWGELWKQDRCPEPAMKPYAEALAFLQQRLLTHPQWQKSALYPFIANQ